MAKKSYLGFTAVELDSASVILRLETANELTGMCDPAQRYWESCGTDMAVTDANLKLFAEVIEHGGHGVAWWIFDVALSAFDIDNGSGRYPEFPVNIGWDWWKFQARGFSHSQAKECYSRVDYKELERWLKAVVLRIHNEEV